jgi:hypothetical protein
MRAVDARVGVAAGCVVAVGLVAYAPLRDLHTVDHDLVSVGAVLAAFALAIAVYLAACASGDLWASASARQRGATVGLAVGALWSAEVCFGNLGVPAGTTVAALCAIAALVCTGLAGAVGVRARDRTADGIAAGIWAGMVGGLATLATLLLLAYVATGRLAAQPQSIRELARSGEPDMRTYLYTDAGFGGVAHLWIGLVTGAALGALGAAVGRAR